jgi:tetratricopeptide (TPR) repeat protein
MSDKQSDPDEAESSAAGEKLSGFDRFVARIKQGIWILLTIWVFIVVCTELKPRILVEPVAVPKTLADQGVTEVIAQQRLTADLMKVIADASTTMPTQIHDAIEADEPEANIELESAGISLQAVIQYTKRMLGFHDVSIRAALVQADDGLYTLNATIANSTTQVIDGAMHTSDPAAAIAAGADLIMKARNKFVYASALAARARVNCYQGAECDYSDAVQAFRDVLDDEGSRRYFKWSWLALSKIDEDQANYGDEVTKAMLSIKDDQTFYWGYYNWGIGLAEQGCGKEALEAFETALQYHPMLDFGYNAAGRQALDLALDEGRVTENAARIEHVNRALGYLMTATAINANYDEAYVNLGEAILELNDPTEREDARSQFVAAILGESSQVKRAHAAMEERGLSLPRDLAEGPSLPTIEALDDAHVTAPGCGNGAVAKSVRSANGCLSTREEQILHTTGFKPLTRARHHFAAASTDNYCREASVAENVGKLQPFLLNPVYGSWPVTGGKPVMIGP